MLDKVLVGLVNDNNGVEFIWYVRSVFKGKCVIVVQFGGNCGGIEIVKLFWCVQWFSIVVELECVGYGVYVQWCVKICVELDG